MSEYGMRTVLSSALIQNPSPLTITGRPAGSGRTSTTITDVSGVTTKLRVWM